MRSAAAAAFTTAAVSMAGALVANGMSIRISAGASSLESRESRALSSAG